MQMTVGGSRHYGRFCHDFTFFKTSIFKSGDDTLIWRITDEKPEIGDKPSALEI